MNHTKNPTALQSQEWILQALLDIMQDKDYDKITVSEVCRKAELDRRTFYRNYDSKKDVLQQYVDRLCHEYLAEFHKTDRPDQYSATLLFFRFWKKHLQFIKNIRGCGLSTYVFDQFKNFSQSQEDFLIGKNEQNDKMNYILAFQIGGFWNVMLTWAENNAEPSPEELAALLSKR